MERRTINIIRRVRLPVLIGLTVVGSVVMTLGITSIMSVFFHGEIVRDYLLTGTVASFLVSFTMVSIISLFIKEVQLAEEAAREASRAKSDFVATMSHEIRTPMHAILGYAELIEGQTTRDEKTASYLRSIRVNGELLLTIINDILDFAKIESGTLELNRVPVSFRTVLEELLDLFRIPAGRKGLQLEINVGEEVPPFLLLDNAHFKEILFNLIGNAIKFTETGSVRITAIARHPSPDDDHIDLQIAIQDTGIGIPGEDLATIFDPFSQRRRQDPGYGGTGLGLAIVRRLVEMMGGNIRVDSRPGRGTDFFVSFPSVKVVSASSPEERPATAPAEPSKRRVARILIVDDAEENRILLERFLEIPGVSVSQAANGQEAIELLSAEDFDLVFMDKLMPVMDGVEAARRIRQNDEIKKIPLVLITADALHDQTDETTCPLFDAIIYKPVKRGVLLKIVEKYTSKR